MLCSSIESVYAGYTPWLETEEDVKSGPIVPAVWIRVSISPTLKTSAIL